MSADLRLKVFEATSLNKDDVIKEIHEFIETHNDHSFPDGPKIDTTSAFISYDEKSKQPLFAYSFCMTYRQRNK